MGQVTTVDGDDPTVVPGSSHAKHIQRATAIHEQLKNDGDDLSGRQLIPTGCGNMYLHEHLESSIQPSTETPHAPCISRRGILYGVGSTEL